jgi:hypothetical protein
MRHLACGYAQPIAAGAYNKDSAKAADAMTALRGGVNFASVMACASPY